MGNKHDIHWEEKFVYAKRYYEYYGNLDVPKDFKTNDGINYDPNGKVNLDSWVKYQRKHVDFRDYRGKKLLTIGMDFTSRRKVRKVQHWEEMYKICKAYYDYYGNLDVPAKFKTNDGINYDPNGKPLKTWLECQKKSTASDSREGKMLLEMGMIFSKKDVCYSKQEWKRMYSYAKMYYLNNGNLYVPRDFKTNNGFAYDENGKIELGKWILEQRKIVKEGSTEWKKLNEIGMVFDLRKDRKDKVALCIENGINYSKKNASIVHSTPMLELQAKLYYLKETGKSIFKQNGEDLHRIFSMTDVALKREYNISLEELIENYNKRIQR